MAVHVIYLKLEGYIRMWLIRKFSDGKEPIIFPKWSIENDILQENIQRKPKDWMPVKEDGTIAIKVPKREGFNRNTWCYVSKQTLVFLRKCILKHFVKDFMAFLAIPNSATPTYKLRILACLRHHGDYAQSPWCLSIVTILSYGH